MGITEILFFILAGLTILTALCTILTKNPVHSILYLIVTFFSISGHYILLNAQFLAVVNIIVYAGAIMVLFLFVMMLMNLNDDKKAFSSSSKFLVAAVISGLFLVLSVGILKENEQSAHQMMDIGHGEIGLVKNLGRKLYSEYVLPFELSSILFISAMIGAVMLSKKDKELN